MSIPSWVRVGAKVVCVNDDPNLMRVNAVHPGLDGLSKNSIYTISGTYIDPWVRCLMVRLVEITRRFEPMADGEAGFIVSRFRPVQTLRQDVRMVKALIRQMPASKRLDRLRELSE